MQVLDPVSLQNLRYTQSVKALCLSLDMNEALISL